MRAAILANRFDDYATEFLGRYRPVDERVRTEQKAKWAKQAFRG
jgi:hypothetical protein